MKLIARQTYNSLKETQTNDHWVTPPQCVQPTELPLKVKPIGINLLYPRLTLSLGNTSNYKSNQLRSTLRNSQRTKESSTNKRWDTTTTSPHSKTKQVALAQALSNMQLSTSLETTKNKQHRE